MHHADEGTQASLPATRLEDAPIIQSNGNNDTTCQLKKTSILEPKHTKIDQFLRKKC